MEAWWRRRLVGRWTTAAVVTGGAAVLVVLAALAFFAWPETVSPWAIFVPSLVLLVALLVRLKLPRNAVVIIACAATLYAAYFEYTSFGQRNFDGGEQLNYVKYVAEKHALPPADACFVCHHPPAYYVAAAVTYKAFKLTRAVRSVKGTQLLSLLITLGFVIFGTLTLQRFTRREWIMGLGTALIAFWPYTIMNAARLHNDVLVSAAMAGCLYFLVKWYQDERPTDLWLAGTLAVVALLSKTNGFIVVAAIALTVIYKVFRADDRRRLLKRAAPALSIVALCVVAFTFLRGPGSSVDTRERVLGTATKIGVHEWVGNEPVNYLYFDVEEYLTEPYVFAYRDTGGRQYYWNHLLKSSLFATHNKQADAETAFRWNMRIAHVMGFLLLAMLLYLAAALMMRRREGLLDKYAVPIISSGCFIGGHMAFRSMVPAAHHGDFRMVHPIVIAFVIAFVLSVDVFEQRRVVAGRVGMAIGGLFVLLSALYFFPKFDFVQHVLPPKVVLLEEWEINERRAEGTHWENELNLIIRMDEIVELKLRPDRDVGSLEITLDHNDTYTIELIAAHETRTVIVGPRPPDDPPPKDPFVGLALYDVTIDPPVKLVDRVRIKPHDGDWAYAMGHVIVDRQPPPPPLDTPEDVPTTQDAPTPEAPQDDAPTRLRRDE